MSFGVEINDIMGLFNGALLEDFATGDISGSEVILREIEFASEEAQNYLDATAISFLKNGLEPHIIEPISGSEGYFIELIGIPDRIEIRDGSNLERGSGFDCNNRCELNYEVFDIFVDYTIDGNTVLLGDDYDGQSLIISYSSPDLKLPSVARYVRNKAACLLSHILYTAGSDTWALTDELCNQASNWEKKHEKNKLIPPELRGLRYLQGSPFNIGIFSVRVRRS